MDGGQPEPGWYPDPAGGGGRRWWTGAGWSEHAAPAPTAPVEATVPSTLQPVPAPVEHRHRSTPPEQPYAGSWSVPGTGEPILRPGYDDPMLRGYAGASADSYRSWFASIAGFGAAILALGLGRPDFSLLFAAIGFVPLLLLPGKLAARRRAVGVARSAARKEGRRPGSRPSERLLSWREIALGIVVALLAAGYGMALWAAARPASPPRTSAVAPEPRGTLADGRATFDDVYGTFAPVTRTGDGDATVAMPADAKAVVAHVTHTGTGPLRVLAVDSAGGTTEAGEVRGSGAWSTTAAFGLNLYVSAPVRVEVKGTGSWTLTMTPVSSVPEFRLPAHGSASGVFLYAGSSGSWVVTHAGTSSFSLTTFNTNGTPYPMVEQVGTYRGSAMATEGYTIVAIRGDGAWTVSAR